MNIPKTLTSLLAASTLAFSNTGCQNQYPEYQFNGVIEGENLHFSEQLGAYEFFVSRTNGTKLLFKGDRSTKIPQVMELEITRGSNTTAYSLHNLTEVSSNFINDSKPVLDVYLRRINSHQHRALDETKLD